MGGDPEMIASVVTSPWFSAALVVSGVGYLVFVGEPQKGAVAHIDHAICGRNSGGLITDLLKTHHHQLGPVRAIWEQAKSKGDPKAYLAAACRRNGNGGEPDLMAAADRLIARPSAANYFGT